MYLFFHKQSAVGKHQFYLLMIQAEKSQNQFKSFYGMASFTVNNSSSQVVNYVIFFAIQ